MFRKLRTLLLAGLGTVAITCGAGFSYWFYTVVSEREIKSGAEIEDIYENYNAGKPNPITQYEMYLYPSTWYLTQYNDANTLPEKMYGYIDRRMDKDGTIVDTYYNSAGVKVENIEVEGVSKPNVPESSIKSYCYDIDRVDSNNTYYTFKKPKNSDDNLTQNGALPNFKNPGLGDDKTAFPNLNGGYHAPSGNTGWYDFSSPSEDLTDVDDIPSPDSDSYFADTKRPFYQKLNIDDRLGYWYELSASEGRFLPIKISFSGSISPQTFLKLVRNPRADLSDSNGWHNYKFGNWIYYHHSMGSKKAYTQPAEGFSNYDRGNLFDVIDNLESMSVVNPATGKREIRLFPIFTNGKDYKEIPKKCEGKQDTTSIEFLSQGYRDGLKVDYKTKDLSGDYDYQTRYFTFEEGSQKIPLTIDGTPRNYNVAVLNNFNTDDKDLSYIDFSGVYSEFIEESDFHLGKLHYDYSYGYDYGNWSNDKANFGDDATTFNPSYDTSSSLSPAENNRNLFSQGDKNIYAIAVDRTFSSANAAKNAIQPLINEMHKAAGGNDSKGLVGCTEGRTLVPIYNYDSNDNKLNNIIIVKFKNSKYRAYALYFERILDFKIITDAPVSPTPVGTTGGSYNINVYEEANAGDLKKHYETVYDTSRNLFLEDNTFYLGQKNGNKFVPNKDSSGNPVSLNSTNKFIYKINNLDLSKAQSLFSSIRIEKEYSELSKNVEFDINPIKDTSNPNLALYEHTGQENYEINGDESNVFVNAGKYIEYVQLKEKGNSNTYNAFKLREKDDEGKEISPYGFYSIVIVFNPTTDHPFKFDVYVYKQKNLFVKIFDKNPGIYNATDNPRDGFLNHYSGEYYECQYDYNVLMTKNDEYKNSQNPADIKKIGDVFKQYCTIRHSYTGDNTDFYKDKVDDGDEIYYLIDHVTKTIIAKAQYTGDFNGQPQFDIKITSGTILNIQKNYVTYVISNSQYIRDEFNPLKPSTK